MHLNKQTQKKNFGAPAPIHNTEPNTQNTHEFMINNTQTSDFSVSSPSASTFQNKKNKTSKFFVQLASLAAPPLTPNNHYHHHHHHFFFESDNNESNNGNRLELKNEGEKSLGTAARFARRNQEVRLEDEERR